MDRRARHPQHTPTFCIGEPRNREKESRKVKSQPMEVSESPIAFLGCQDDLVLRTGSVSHQDHGIGNSLERDGVTSLMCAEDLSCFLWRVKGGCSPSFHQREGLTSSSLSVVKGFLSLPQSIKPRHHLPSMKHSCSSVSTW